NTGRLPSVQWLHLVSPNNVLNLVLKFSFILALNLEQSYLKMALSTATHVGGTGWGLHFKLLY
uniref:hypothetical protein n=1 Tax=Moraxella canis TaxID=90239 RepID=UPI001964DE30